jgi:hypothetical protein
MRLLAVENVSESFMVKLEMSDGKMQWLTFWL